MALSLALLVILTACGGTATSGTMATSGATATTTATATTATTAAATAASANIATTAAQTAASATTAGLTTGPAATTGAKLLTGPFTAADLVLAIDGQPFVLLSDVTPLLAKLGKQYEMTKAESCVYEGFDKTFDYGYLQVFTIPKDKADLLDGIYLTDGRYKTARGVKVGDPVSAMEAAYGKPPAGGDAVYNQSGKPENLSEPSLTFVVENGRITAISYYSGSNAQAATR